METVFKKNEDIFLPKDAVSPLCSLMPAVYQVVVRQGPSAHPVGREWSGAHLLATMQLRAHAHCWATLMAARPMMSRATRRWLELSELLPKLRQCQAFHSVTFVIPQHPHVPADLSPFPDEEAEPSEVRGCPQSSSL